MSKIKKCFIVIFFVLMLFVLNQIDVEASTYDYNGTDVVLPDISTITDLPSGFDIDRYFIAYNTNGYYLFFMKCDFTGNVITTLGEGGDKIYTSDEVNLQAYLLRNGGWLLENRFNSAVNFKYILYSTIDIYNTDGTIFFLKPSVTLGEIMEVVAKEASLEITQVILIVIAVTGGLIILLIGLRKGLTTLVNGLRV